MKGWRRVLEADDFRLHRSKMKYIECKFNNRRNIFNLEMNEIGDHMIPQVLLFKYFESIVQNDRWNKKGHISSDLSRSDEIWYRNRKRRIPSDSSYVVEVEENVTCFTWHKVPARWLKWRRILDVLCDMRVPFKLNNVGYCSSTWMNVYHGLILLIIYSLSHLLCMIRYSFNGQKSLWRLFQMKY